MATVSGSFGSWDMMIVNDKHKTGLGEIRVLKGMWVRKGLGCSTLGVPRWVEVPS